jgi:predicted O-methyltransferase YrrM
MNVREMGIVIRNMFLGGNVDSLLSLGDPRTAAYYVTECRFLHRSIFPDGGLLARNVWEVLDVDEVSVMLYSEAAQEWFRPMASYTADLVAMCMLCQILKPKIIFEIGTFRGAGALHWAGNARNADVYTLDLPAAAAPSLAVTEVDMEHVSGHSQTTRMMFDGRAEASRIHRLYGDSATFDFTPFLEQVDLLFIDGAHSYEYVRNDTLRAGVCCKPGSMIAWHDYGRVGFNGVSKWLHEYSREGRAIYRVPGGSLAYTRVSSSTEPTSAKNF